jgi:hypothetical protein
VSIDALRLVRNILLRSFVIGIVFAIVYLVLTLAFWNTWVALAMAWWRTDEQHLSALVLNFFTTLRFYLVFVLLVPALAIQWTISSERKRASP